MTVLDVQYNTTKGEEHGLACNSCVRVTFHEVLASVDQKVGFLSAVGFTHYQIVVCKGCRTTTFRKLTKTPAFGTLLNPSRKTKAVKSVDELYPPRYIHRRQIDEWAFLPEGVRGIYTETYRALVGRQPILAGIGVRALLETICKERSATGNTLQAKIDSLVAMGLLTQESADFLHSLRILGNQAAHDVVPHSEEKLTIAMDLIEYLLMSVYIIPRKAAKLQKA